MSSSNQHKNHSKSIPLDGIKGLVQNWKSDMMSGFLVFLLALPLSLGIAKASEFPPAMGVLTAMIGGLLVSFFAGSRLTIKGPAAGLITICAGGVMAMSELSGGDKTEGWHLILGAAVVAALIQIGFGLLKFGSLSDFFPHSAVHGMLAAIGILIFAKQFPVLLGVDPSMTKGMTPIQLYEHIPNFIANANGSIATIGLLSLLIMFILPAMGGVFKKIPAPMIVLLIAVPMAAYMGLSSVHDHSGKPFSLVKIGDFWGTLGFNASFAAIGTFTFWKFVFMFLFVNTIESLLTVKAIDGMDPYKRKSDYNKDLVAVGVGNAFSGLLGGLPMISEVARSSANVNNGGKTRWANFFHGFFLLIAMLAMIPVIEMIPNAALAAMLIFVAYRLASPKEFIGTYKIGAEQLAIFLVTIIVTVAEDLLLGVAAGILTKLIIQVVNGAPLRSLFKARYTMKEHGKHIDIQIHDAAIFSNFLGYKKLWETIPGGHHLTFDFSDCVFVDHSFMDQLHLFEEEYHSTGGEIKVVGLENFNPFSSHPAAARKKVSHT